MAFLTETEINYVGFKRHLINTYNFCCMLELVFYSSGLLSVSKLAAGCSTSLILQCGSCNLLFCPVSQHGTGPTIRTIFLTREDQVCKTPEHFFYPAFWLTRLGDCGLPACIFLISQCSDGSKGLGIEPRT